MNNLSWKDKRIAIQINIKKISDYYGGDDKEWLIAYIAHQVKQWSNTPERLQAALKCFAEIKDQLVGAGRAPRMALTSKQGLKPGGRYEFMAREAAARQQQVVGDVESRAVEDLGQHGWIVCGVRSSIQSASGSMPKNPAAGARSATYSAWPAKEAPPRRRRAHNKKTKA